ncbi:MAG: hypothetical protein KF814_11630 [Nitrospiraceae bacterium]|nr:hypothetical protein [Nitrospiraceae bacterium]
MIRGYAGNPSVLPGGQLSLHVSTTAPEFRVRLFRQDTSLVFVQESDWLEGRHVLEPSTALDRTGDWNWPAYTIPVPSDWPSGVYLAQLVEGREGKPIRPPEGMPRFDGRDGRILFVVKSAAPGTKASILYNLPLFTYQAYNYTGRLNFYMKGDPPDADRVHRVSLRRPGAGTGGDIGGEYDDHCGSACDWYDDSSPRNTFAHWDAPFLTWLASHGYRVDVCTDLDLHEGSATLPAYRLLLCVGHHEYWSTEMRDHAEAFVKARGNIAWFSGNTCWWRVRVRLDGAQLECRKIDNGDLWWSGARRPENHLTGVSFQNGGGWWGGEAREPLGFTVQHPESWVFEGTGLKAGDTFGREAALVGFECDGASVSNMPQPGQAMEPDHRDGTPSSFRILGWARLRQFGNGVTGWWNEGPAPTGKEVRLATMGLFTDGGTVFNAATTDWVRVLVQAREAHTERITHNVLQRLSGQVGQAAVEPQRDGLAGRLVQAVTTVGCFFAALRTSTTRRPVLFGGLRFAWRLGRLARLIRFP